MYAFIPMFAIEIGRLYSSGYKKRIKDIQYFEVTDGDLIGYIRSDYLKELNEIEPMQ